MPQQNVIWAGLFNKLIRTPLSECCSKLPKFRGKAKPLETQKKPGPVAAYTCQINRGPPHVFYLMLCIFCNISLQILSKTSAVRYPRQDIFDAVFKCSDLLCTTCFSITDVHGLVYHLSYIVWSPGVQSLGKRNQNNLADSLPQFTLSRLELPNVEWSFF